MSHSDSEANSRTRQKRKITKNAEDTPTLNEKKKEASPMSDKLSTGEVVGLLFCLMGGHALLSEVTRSLDKTKDSGRIASTVIDTITDPAKNDFFDSRINNAPYKFVMNSIKQKYIEEMHAIFAQDKYDKCLKNMDSL